MKRRLLIVMGLLLLSPLMASASARPTASTEKLGRVLPDKTHSSPTVLAQNQNATPIAWDTPASGFSGEEGQTYTFRCPGGGTAQSIYGSGVYTADSSICTAAVHMGLIRLEHGGIVTIEFRPGRSAYGSTTRHGVKSNSWGQYDRSFVIRASDETQDSRSQDRRNSARASDNEDTEDITPIAWDTPASGFSGEEGQTYTFRCPGGGTAQSIYGSGVYTADSSICTAAVHMGLISLARGGKVTVEFRPGRSAYGSTTRHGVKSNSWGQYDRSYVVR